MTHKERLNKPVAAAPSKPRQSLHGWGPERHRPPHPPQSCPFSSFSTVSSSFSPSPRPPPRAPWIDPTDGATIIHRAPPAAAAASPPDRLPPFAAASRSQSSPTAAAALGSNSTRTAHRPHPPHAAAWWARWLPSFGPPEWSIPPAARLWRRHSPAPTAASTAHSSSQCPFYPPSFRCPDAPGTGGCGWIRSGWASCACGRWVVVVAAAAGGIPTAAAAAVGDVERSAGYGPPVGMTGWPQRGGAAVGVAWNGAGGGADCGRWGRRRAVAVAWGSVGGPGVAAEGTSSCGRPSVAVVAVAVVVPSIVDRCSNLTENLDKKINQQ